MSEILISVSFHDGRYHGAGDWPPSPARLFQALVAGAARGVALELADAQALEWLEKRDAPIIAAPHALKGKSFTNFVPNNDLDAVGGDPEDAGKIRVGKTIRPMLFDGGAPLFYVWRFDRSDEMLAERICAIAKQLYQFGCGVDMAWAQAELLDTKVVKKHLEEHGGTIYRPAEGSNGILQACPGPGSLKSLIERHKAMGKRFRREEVKGKKTQYAFVQPFKPRFRQIAYDSPSAWWLYDLRDRASKFRAWPLTQIVKLTETVRDKAEERLATALPDKAACIKRVFGRGRDLTEADKAQRIRVTPLPSIGHSNAESSIRRVLVEIPPNCPLPAGDLEWAFSGLHLGSNLETGEILDDSLPLLVEADDWRMPGHYGVGQNGKPMCRLWRTITPAALPIRHGRGKREGNARVANEKEAEQAVIRALRHAHILARAETIHVQREPFEAKGARADTFAPGTRFPPSKLWHVEIAFAAPLYGPLIIGDGRYLGLGLMRPIQNAVRDLMVFPLREPAVPATDAPALLHAVRRALMALSRDDKQKRNNKKNQAEEIDRLFSGHESDGTPARANGHEHIFLAADDADHDGRIDRIIVAAPWICDRTKPAPPRWKCALFERVATKLQTVRAGRLGIVTLGRPFQPPHRDPLTGSASVWESRTPYRPTRHAGRGKNPKEALIADVFKECARRGLPRPEVTLLKFESGPKGGNVRARLRLAFQVAIEGPLMLGRDSHKGGGLFAAADDPADAPQ